MSNHGYVTTKKWLKVDIIEENLKQILQNRFDGKIPYCRNDDQFEIGFGYPWSFDMWVENVHKIEFRNPQPTWCWWIMVVIQNELAIMYNGTISDDGVNEKWKGTPNKYPEFKDYLAVRYSHLSSPIKWFVKNIEKHAGIPLEVKQTYDLRRK